MNITEFFVADRRYVALAWHALVWECAPSEFSQE